MGFTEEYTMASSPKVGVSKPPDQTELKWQSIPIPPHPVEEQEKDLVKAEGLYRAAMADKGLSKEARFYARYRLVALLRRLGKGDEAKAVKAGGKGSVLSLDDRQEEEQGAVQVSIFWSFRISTSTRRLS